MAKMIIDIQDDVYKALKEDIYPIPDTERLAIVFKVLVKKGKLLPDNATNGDVLKALFNNRGYISLKARMEHTMWWNSPYKVGETDGNS